MKFSGKNVLITGASKGIGASIAKTLASFGLKVWINYRSKPELADALKDEILAQGGNAAVIKFDARKEDEFENGIKTIVESDGELSYLVNNAGVLGCQLANADEKSFDAALETNIKGPFFLSKIVGEYMKNNHIHNRKINMFTNITKKKHHKIK